MSALPKNNFKSMLTELQKIERKYGSINNVPQGDPDLIKLSELNPKGNYHYKEDKEYKKRRIKSLFERGYQVDYISQKLNLSQNYVLAYLNKHHMKHKPLFEYKIIYKSHQVFYTNSLDHFLHVALNKNYVCSPKKATDYLKRQNFQVIPGDYIWKNIKENEYILTNNMIFPAKITQMDSPWKNIRQGILKGKNNERNR